MIFFSLDRIGEETLQRRLQWLLVFRAAVATGLLALTMVADAAQLTLPRISALLYGVCISGYLVVLVLGTLLRRGALAAPLAMVHVVWALMLALIAVEGTGGIESGLTFLFLLAVLDGALLGGRRLAMLVATLASLGYGAQIAWHLHAENAGDARLAATTSSFVLHLSAFYLIAFLAGHLAELLAAARDDARSARTDLHRMGAVHAEVLATLPVGVVVLGLDGAIHSINQAGTSLLQRGFGGGEPKSVVSAARPWGKEGQIWSDALGKVPIGQSEVTWEAGETACHVALHRSRMPKEILGDPLDIVVMDDRTALHRLEGNLRAQERLASIGELAAGIAHELRNPLAAISGCVELLGEEDGDKAEASRLQGIIGREILRLNTLIGDFLVYARPMQPKFDGVDLELLAQNVCTMLGQDPRFASIVFETSLPGEHGIEGDRDQLQQVFWNLLLNAAEASSPGDRVAVRAGIQSSDESESMMIVEICDQGAGVCAEMRDHLFEPFRTSKAAGTGLGLAMVHRIVEAHGGDVALYPGEIKGTVARICLPKRDVANKEIG